MQKNFIVFILACMLILMGWMWLQNQLFPARRPNPAEQAKKEEKKDDKDKEKEKEKDKERKEEKPPAVAEVKPAEKKEEKKTEQKKAEEKKEPERAPETYTLGGPDTHLQALLTTKGAGVQRLVLTRFQAADYLGKPLPHELELIQDDPFSPSFVLYHYPEADSEHPVFGLGEKIWKFEGQDKAQDGTAEIRFSTTVPGHDDIKITKTYRLAPRDYHLGLTLEIERAKQKGDAKETKFRYQMIGPHGMPVEGEWYTNFYRKAIIGTVDSSGNLWRDLDNEDSYRISFKQGGIDFPARAHRGDTRLQYAGVATQYFASMIVVDDNQPDKQVAAKDVLAWARPTLETTERGGKLLAIGPDTILLGEADKVTSFHILPHVKRHLEEAGLKKNDPVMVAWYETSAGQRVASWVRRGQGPRPFLDDITVRVNSEPIALAPGDKVSHQFLLYNGPVKVRLLDQFSGDKAVPEALVDRYAETLHLRSMTDYGSIGFFRSIGWSTILIWTTSRMHELLWYLHYVVFGSYGLSIILLTVVVRGLMFPISRKAALYSMRMQELAPEMKKLQEQYKNDPQKKGQAVMELYRKHNVHPLGACLPMLLQLPIFLGLYYALQESIHFRLASFLWVDNLAAPDMLAWWTENIPVISSPDNQSGVPRTGLFDSLAGFFYLGPYFNLLPLFAVTLMFIQQKLMAPPPTDEQQAMTQKTMQIMMIVMGVVFYRVASGLCIYFIASSLWGVAERKLLPKKKKPGEIGRPAPLPNGKAGGGGRGKPKPSAKPDKDGLVQRVKDWWAKVLEEARKK